MKWHSIGIELPGGQIENESSIKHNRNETTNYSDNSAIFCFGQNKGSNTFANR
jgi:hypothetical protein